MGQVEGLLKGTRTVVTGAARGIGLSVARRFAEEGASVILADVNIEGASRAARDLHRDGFKQVMAIELDVTDEASLTSAVQRSVADLGGVDCVVANAGILHLSHVVDMRVDDWRRVVDVNLTGVFLTCKFFARQMLEQGHGGRIIVTGSLFSRRGGVENGAYAAAKFGVLGLTECLAAELAPHGVLVNAVCPGQVDTPMMKQLIRERAQRGGDGADAVEARLLSRIPTGRLADPAEVADAYVFLASRLSRYVTGQAIVVDGGWEVG
jgi:NAD(P)-dependent dehydrogenase (short-subunit alcohol dehydrogenase family)